MILDTLSWGCLIGGSLFTLVGGLGIWLMPDFYTRLHAASIVDTLGAWLILLGLIFQSPDTSTLLKLISVWALLLFASPTTSHALARAAHLAGLKPLIGNSKVAGDD